MLCVVKIFPKSLKLVQVIQNYTDEYSVCV